MSNKISKNRKIRSDRLEGADGWVGDEATAIVSTSGKIFAGFIEDIQL